MTLNALRILAWLLLAAIVFATMGPIGLRPTSHYPVQLERAAAFSVVGLVFVIAYPRQVALIGVLVLAGAIVLEVLQNLIPDRHGREIDAMAKIVGAVAGIAMGHIANKMAAKRTRP